MPVDYKPIKELRENVWFGNPGSPEEQKSLDSFKKWAREIETGDLPLWKVLFRIWCNGFQHGGRAGERYESFRRH